ncbi:MAG: diguanylate cyclase [Asticcacaulis sp.]
MSIGMRRLLRNIGSKRSWRVRTLAVSAFLIAFIPVVVACAIAVWWTGRAYQEVASAQLSETARTVSRSITNELSLNAIVLRSEASGQAIYSNGRGGQGQVHETVLPSGASIIYTSGVDRVTQLMRAGLPEAVARQVAFPDDMAFSDIFFPLTETGAEGAPSIALSVPRGRNRGHSGVAVQIIPAHELIRSLDRDEAHENRLLIAVTDSHGRIIARSEKASESIGKLAPDWGKLKDLEGEGSTFHAHTLFGEPIAFTYQPIKGVEGWMVVAGEPVEAYTARWMPPMLMLGVVFLMALIVGVALVLWLTRLILQPVRALVDRTHYVLDTGRLSHDAAPVMPESFVQEFEQLRQSLIQAEDILHEKAEAERKAVAELALSEKRYRTLAEAGALVFWVREEDGAIRTVTGWKELTGQSDPDAVGEGWMGKIHLDDRAGVAIEWKKALDGKGHIDVEFRVQTTQGSWVWVRARGARFRTGEGDATQWIGVLEDVNERRQAESRIAYLAHHDALTGLCNRVVLREKLGQAIEASSEGLSCAMHYIDLDRFKAVNDTLGHAVGDALLVAVTARIRALVRETDTIARLGGDEFAIIQTDIQSEEDAEGLAQRLVKKLSAPYKIEGHRVSIGASVGISLIRAEDNADQILRQADGALYKAKRGGRGGHRLHGGLPDQVMH